MPRHAGGSGSHQSVCPYCHEPYATQDELVAHLTDGDGCPRRGDYSPKHRGKRARR